MRKLAWMFVMPMLACGSNSEPIPPGAGTSPTGEAAQTQQAPTAQTPQAPTAPAPPAAPAAETASARFFAFADRASANAERICDCLSAMSMGMMPKHVCLAQHKPKIGEGDPAKEACIRAALDLDPAGSTAYVECMDRQLGVAAECFGQLDCSDMQAVRGSMGALAACAERLQASATACPPPEPVRAALAACEGGPPSAPAR